MWLEVFHACKVDRQQAEDFAIEGLPLFETNIPDNYTFYGNITLEGDKKRNLYGSIMENGLAQLKMQKRMRNISLFCSITMKRCKAFV